VRGVPSRAFAMGSKVYRVGRNVYKTCSLVDSRTIKCIYSRFFKNSNDESSPIQK